MNLAFYADVAGIIKTEFSLIPPGLCKLAEHAEYSGIS